MMVSMENGRLCVKKYGRDAGRLCVVTNVVDEKTAKVLCAGRKKKRSCNVRHLEPLPQKMDLKEGDADTVKALVKMEEEMKI